MRREIQWPRWIKKKKDVAYRFQATVTEGLLLCLLLHASTAIHPYTSWFSANGFTRLTRVSDTARIVACNAVLVQLFYFGVINLIPPIKICEWWIIYVMMIARLKIDIIIIIADEKQFAFLTHWGRYKMPASWQTTLSFSWMKMFDFKLKCHRTLFLRF